MIRRIALLLSLLTIVAGAYAATPFYAIWQIREAVIAGNVSTLESKVDWASVRQALKASSGGETRTAVLEYSEAAGVPKPGLWQRIKSAALPFVADPLIDRYVTAEGAPQIYGWRQTWRQKVRPNLGLVEPKSVLAETRFADTGIDRGLSLVRRIERAAFVSPTLIEIEMRDRYRPERRWKSVLELQGWSWRLTQVHVLTGKLQAARLLAVN